jgi:hypothetical protein
MPGSFGGWDVLWLRDLEPLTGSCAAVPFWQIKTAFFPTYWKTSTSDYAFSRQRIANLPDNRSAWPDVVGRASSQRNQ